jgi:hypothetical protein
MSGPPGLSRQLCAPKTGLQLSTLALLCVGQLHNGREVPPRVREALPGSIAAEVDFLLGSCRFRVPS